MFGQNDDQNQQTQDDQSAVAPDPALLNDSPQHDFSNGFPGTAPVADPATQDEPVVNAPLPEHETPAEQTPPISGVSDDLLNIKQEALQHLSPLVSHLDQSPEEKFRTTMMMIQASDDQTLLKAAYEAAQQITDDKVRAQALLDVINEINYFTQHGSTHQA